MEALHTLTALTAGSSLVSPCRPLLSAVDTLLSLPSLAPPHAAQIGATMDTLGVGCSAFLMVGERADGIEAGGTSFSAGRYRTLDGTVS